MKIEIKAGNLKKTNENEVGYIAQFMDSRNKEDVVCELPVIYGSRVDTFLKLNRLNIFKVAILDGRIIAVCSFPQLVELVKDQVKEDFTGRDVNSNINYVKETYGIDEDLLEVEVLEALKDSYLQVLELTVNDKSEIKENGLFLDLSSDENSTRLVFPHNTELEEYIFDITGTEDINEALGILMGRSFYVVDYALDVIALVDKETKKISIRRSIYDVSGNLVNNGNLKGLKNIGIDSENLGLIVKRLINQEESK